MAPDPDATPLPTEDADTAATLAEVAAFAREEGGALRGWFAARGLPAVVATGRDNAGMVGAMRPLGFTALYDVFWAGATPLPPPPPPA